MRFKEQIALVTGGSKGLGKIIAKQLVKEGATVIINGRDMDALDCIEEVFAPESIRAFIAGIFSVSKLHHSALPIIFGSF